MGRGCADVARPTGTVQAQGPGVIAGKKKNAIAAQRDMVPRSLLRQPNQAVGATDLGLANGHGSPASSYGSATDRRTNRFARVQHVEGQGGEHGHGLRGGKGREEKWKHLLHVEM